MSEDLLSNLLAKLGAGSKDTIYLSVTPGVGLEMCQIDPQTKTVKSYAVRDLVYNETSRDIADYDRFKDAVSEMFEELKINPKCNVVVNMPLVSLGTMSFPLLLADEAIATGIVSEVEQTYIFRRLEPAVAWQDITSGNAGSEYRKVLYSALQQAVIDNISAALTSLGATLAGVEVSLVSYLRGLDYAGYTTAQMQDNVTWNLMVVSSTGYSLTSLVGKSIVDYYEEPLAIKTFEGDDIYNAINASAQITLMSYPANYLYIVSETDQVSAELLSKKIQGAGTIDYLENNSFKKHEVLPVSLDILPDNVLKISLQAVGCATSNIASYPLKFNFLGTKTTSSAGEEPVSIAFGDKSFEITPTAAMNMALLTAVLIAVPLVLLAYMLLPNVEAEKQQKLDDVNVRIQDVEDQLKKMDGEKSKANAFELKKEVEDVIGSNRSKLMNYSAIGQSIPETVWITYFMTQDNGLVDIKGAATNVEDIYVFFKNMKDSLINTKLRLQKLDMQTASVDDLITSSGPSNYEFEITNMEQSQLAALLGLGGNQAGANNPDGQNAQNNNNNNNSGSGNGLLGNAPLDLGK